MRGKNSAALWLKRLVIAVCIGVIMLSAAIVAVQWNITGAFEAALLALLACLTVIFFTRQFMLRREVEAAKEIAIEQAYAPATVGKPQKSGGFERLGVPQTAEPGSDASGADLPDLSKEKTDAPKKEVASALGKDDLILFLQPIVNLPEKEPVFYQTLLRLKMANGKMLDPAQYRHVARAGGLMAGIDRRNVTQSIRMLKTLHAMNKKAGLFCALSQDSLKNGKDYDRIFSLLQSNTELKDELIVEIDQASYAGAGSAGRKRLEEIAALGFKLCMADVTELKIDLDAIAKSGFGFIKVPASMLIYGQSDSDMISLDTLAFHVSMRAMQLIATDVSREQDVPHIMDRDALIAQGDLFAEPKQVRAELLDEA